MTAYPELDVRRAGGWRHEVLDRVGRLEQELAHGVGRDDARAVARIRQDLVSARRIASGEDGSFDGWSGRNTENAWRHLRLAEEGLVSLVDVDDAGELAAAIDEAVAHGRHHLGADDPLLRELVTLATSSHLGAEDRVRAKELVEDVTVRSHESSTARHQQQRAFRNQLRGLTVVMAVLAVATVVALALLDDGGPQDLLAAPAELPGWLAMALAMGVGSIGALFSAVPSLAQKPSDATAFSTVKEQAALKIVVGAWSAVVGLVVVNAGLGGLDADVAAGGSVGSAAEAATVAGFVVMAAYFGATQEALTRFADRKATAVDPAAS